MSRILKRPMFRIGGSTNEGIVSIAQPRKNYQEGSEYKQKRDELLPLYQEAIGTGRSERNRLMDLLLEGSLALGAGAGAGKKLPQALALSFKDPAQRYMKSGQEEEAAQRQIKLAATTGAISSVDARQLQKMKLDAALADEARKERMLNRELAFKTDPNSFAIYDVLESFKKQGFNPQKITQLIGTGEKAKPSPQSVLSVPEGQIFYDSSNNIYKRVPKEISSVGYIRLDRSGKEIKAEASTKKPGFFQKSEEKGAAYDPRSWNKQRFYEELGKKNTLSNM